MDSQPREITSPTNSTIPISRMDMGFSEHDSSITKRQTSENPERTEKCKEKNLQEENNFCENSSNFNWDAFRYKDTIPQGISLPQMPFYNPSYSNQ
jgi:hypothetical protein